MNTYPIRVLFTGNDPQMSESLKENLSQHEPCQFEFQSTTTLRDTRECLQREGFDVILLELALPDSQGLETLKNVKDFSGETPVLVVTSVGEEGTAQEAVRQGAQDYIVKGESNGKFLTYMICHTVAFKNSQRDLHYCVSFEKLITAISTKFVNLPCDHVDRTIDESLQLVGEFARVDRGYFFILSRNRAETGLIYEWCANGIESGFMKKKELSLSEIPWFSEKLQRQETAVIPSVRRLIRHTDAERELFQSRGIQSILCIPLVFPGDGVGFLGFDSVRQEKEWHEDTISLLRIIGEIFVNAVQRQRTESQLQKLSIAVEQSPTIVMITDAQGNIEYVNPKFSETTGYSFEEVQGKNPRILKSGRVQSDEYRKLWTTIKEGKLWRGEFLNRKKNGELYWDRATISPIKNSEGEITHFLAVMEDITNHKWAEETIQRMAYYDPLTDLPNRMLFNDRLNQALAQAKRETQLVAILVIDLDRFKVVNDTLGHTLGDVLLRSVAGRLKRCMREGDTVARLGGDEFMVLVSGILQVEEAVEAAENILGALKPSFNLQGHEVHITPSIGISIYPYDGTDSVTLLKNSDTALNRAKDKGRTNYQLYTPIMNAKAFERMTLENSLRKALEKGEFIVYYQPQVDLNTGEIVAMEALIRWEHPDLGLVSPAQFIPMAEETGLIIPIGEWVLKTACLQNKAWQNMGHQPIKMAVNLSARQFSQQNLVDMVSRNLQETGLEAPWLDIEITESIIMQNLEVTTSTLRDLHQLGCQISIDDFGTGYSSLSYLKRFPVNALKIAMSFIREITKDSDDAAITSAVIAMAHSLKLQVVAEGVETNEQLKVLQNLKCDRMQGYLFSRPLPAQTITPLFMRGWRLKTEKIP